MVSILEIPNLGVGKEKKGAREREKRIRNILL